MQREATYIDVDLSFTPHPVSGDLMSVKDNNAIKQSVKNIIFTKFGERLFSPDVGSPIPGILFENATPFTAHILQRQIEEVLTNYEPRISLDRINVVGSGRDHSFQIEIIYKIQNSTTQQSLSLLLERTR